MGIKNSKGFTLIELLLSVALGSIIVAGATTLYFTAQKTQMIQSNLADLQERTSLAFTQIKTSLSKSSLYTDNLNQNLKNGIIFNGVPSDEVLVSSSELGPSYVDKKSDQLTVKYQSPQGGYDCEGNAVPANGEVIERYFLRQSKTHNNTLALACDAGRIQSGAIEDFGDDGIELLTGVLYFHTLYAIGSGRNYHSYSNTPNNSDQNSISGVQVGLLISSVGSDKMQKEFEGKSKFQVINQEVTLESDYEKNARKGLIDVIELRIPVNGVGVEL
ncbi:TPA: PilW family protein [Acinetobacter baumannii]